MKQRRVHLLAAATAYLVLTLAMLWPLPLQLGRALPGRVFDIWHNAWNLWWVRYTLWEGKGSLFHTDLLFHPQGTSLLFNTFSLSSTVPALPVTVLWGPVAAYGVLALLSFVLAGIGAYLLLEEVLQALSDLSPAARSGAAFVGGAIFTFSSYHFAHLLAHLNLVALQWLPFYLWALLRLWAARPEGRARSWGRLALAVLFLVLTSWSDWLYSLYAVAVSGLFLVLQLARQRFRGKALWLSTGRLLLVMVLALAILSVQWIPMLREQANSPELRPSPAYVLFFSADPLAYVTPGPAHPLWGRWTAPLYQCYNPGNDTEGVLYLGLVPLALAVVGLVRRWDGRGFWLTVLLAAAVLSLGPVLHFAGEIVTYRGQRVLMPYSLLYLLPLMDILRTPARFGLLVNLATAVLAGVGTARLLQGRPRGERGRLLLAGLLTLLLCAELSWVPYPVTPAQVPPFYRQLANAPDGRAVLEIPIVPYPAEHVERMFYQTVHGHPIFGGFIPRGDPHIPYAEIPGFRAFRSLDLAPDIAGEADAALWQRQALAALNHYGAGYLVLQRGALTPSQLAAARDLADTLLGPQSLLYEDGETVAYRVPPLQASFWEIGPGWGARTWSPGPAPSRLLTGTASLRLILPEAASGRVCLRLTAPVEGGRLSFALDGEEWGQWAMSTAETELCSGPLALAAGRHEAILRVVEGAGCRVHAVLWEAGP